MTSEPPDRPPAEGLVAALPMRRNVAISVAVGVVLAAAVYAVRVLEVLGPAPSRGSPLLFLSLAFVLAAATAGLVFSVLTAVSLRRALTAVPEDPQE